MDPRTGESWSFHNLPGLGGLAAGDVFRRALGIPAALDNDGNCAALGEGRAGAAAGVTDYAVIVIGALPIAGMLSRQASPRARGLSSLAGAIVALIVVARLFGTG